MVSETFDYVQYLDVKKSIDDRSLNKTVWLEFSNWLKVESNRGASIKILEIGAGIGTMIERLLESSLLIKCHYVAIEPEVAFKDAAVDRLKAWADNHSCYFKIDSKGLWRISSNKLDITIEWVEADAGKIDKLFGKDEFNALLSHAVIDLLPVPEIMPSILEKLKAQGGCYFSLNFSGQTNFYPKHENDDVVSASYHADMDSRFPSVDWQPSLTGSTLPNWLKSYGCQKVIDGDSDWQLGKSEELGGLNNEDGLFVRNILDTIKKALAGLPGIDAWLATRYEQLEQGQLAIKISNSDCFGLK